MFKLKVSYVDDIYNKNREKYMRNKVKIQKIIDKNQNEKEDAIGIIKSSVNADMKINKNMQNYASFIKTFIVACVAIMFIDENGIINSIGIYYFIIFVFISSAIYYIYSCKTYFSALDFEQILEIIERLDKEDDKKDKEEVKRIYLP